MNDKKDGALPKGKTCFDCESYRICEAWGIPIDCTICMFGEGHFVQKEVTK